MSAGDYENTDYMEILYRTAISLTGTLKLNDLYELIVSRGCSLTNTTNGFLYVVDEKEEVLELKHGTGIYAVYRGSRRGKDEPSVSSAVWRTGRPLSVESVDKWEGRAVDRPYGWDEVKTVLGIPLYSDAEVIAIIGLGFPDAKRRFSQAEIDLLSRFAALASLALYNARQHQQSPQGQTTGAGNCAPPPAPALPSAITDHCRLARDMWKKAQLQLADIQLSAADEAAARRAIATDELLTDRERQVLDLLSKGLSNQEIAQQMSVAVTTVKAHASHIFAKLGVNRRVQAIIKARQMGLL